MRTKPDRHGKEGGLGKAIGRKPDARHGKTTHRPTDFLYLSKRRFKAFLRALTRRITTAIDKAE